METIQETIRLTGNDAVEYFELDPDIELNEGDRVYVELDHSKRVATWMVVPEGENPANYGLIHISGIYARPDSTHVLAKSDQSALFFFSSAIVTFKFVPTSIPILSRVASGMVIALFAFTFASKDALFSMPFLTLY